VEGDRDAEALTKRARDTPQMGHRDREDDDRVRALAVDELLEMPLPAGSDPAADRFTGQPVEAALLRVRLLTPEVAIALEPREHPAHRFVRLALPKRRVGGDAPPRRLPGSPAVRRDDEVDSRLGHALPQLPPRGRAAVAEVEVDRGRDREDLRRPHRG